MSNEDIPIHLHTITQFEIMALEIYDALPTFELQILCMNFENFWKAISFRFVEIDSWKWLDTYFCHLYKSKTISALCHTFILLPCHITHHRHFVAVGCVND